MLAEQLANQGPVADVPLDKQVARIVERGPQRVEIARVGELVQINNPALALADEHAD